MPTKAELETELTELRQHLAQMRVEKRDAPVAAPDPDVEQGGHEWSVLLDELMAEFEDLPEKKPLLLALGAFVAGVMIGRIR